MIFTEEEKNDIAVSCVNIMVAVKKIGCPFSLCELITSEVPCVDLCGKIFSKTDDDCECPCFFYEKEEVKDRFWKALE